jgi:hypothetical protein
VALAVLIPRGQEGLLSDVASELWRHPEEQRASHHPFRNLTLRVGEEKTCLLFLPALPHCQTHPHHRTF